jgi:fatty-acyl-CoA synthase
VKQNATIIRIKSRFCNWWCLGIGRRLEKMDLKELIAISNKTWGRAFDETVAKYPEKEAFVYKSSRITYKNAQDHVNNLAKGLIKLGVKKGDKVAVWMTNRLEWVYSQLAIVKIGGTLVPLSTRYKDAEIEHCLRQSDVNTLIFADNFLGKIDSVKMLEELSPEIFRSEMGKLELEKFPLLKNIIICGERKFAKGIRTFNEVLQLGNDPLFDIELTKAALLVNPDDIVCHLYTSGTTGPPKAVMNSHRGWLIQFYLVISPDYLGITENDRILGALIFSGGMGIAQVPISMLAGATLVIMETFDAEEALKIIQDERITTPFILVGTMVTMMLQNPNRHKYDISSVKKTDLSGMPVTADLISAMYRELGFEKVLNVYGTIETHGSGTMLKPGDSFEQLTTTIGKPLPHVLLKIINPNTGEELPLGQNGEICLKGASPEIKLSYGYYKMPKKTAELIDKDGWVHTGDLGRIRREDGYVMITGRVKDMIIVGGYNVYPIEVEELLQKHPSIETACVVGVPDQRLGEVPVAFVRLKEGASAAERELIDFCKDKLANYKAPRYIKFIAEFPLAEQGKIKKAKLREVAIKELSLA